MIFKIWTFRTDEQSHKMGGEIMNRRMKKAASLLTLVLVVFSGCATESGLTERETGGLAGAALGAGIGALAGSATGHAGVGTAIGAGAGLLTGAVAGEMARRQKEQTKKEIRQEMMQQQYQPGYTPQPYSAQGVAPVQQQPQSVSQTATQPVRQELNTKYNPRTGQTFPSSYTFDPNTGEELKPLQ